MFVSLIVTTCNRPDALSAVLAALGRQSDRVLPAGEAVRLASALTDFMANPAPFPLHRLDGLRRHVSWDSHIRLLLSLPWRAS